MENTTNSILNRVRVEIHLSNGVELGPTTPVDMAPGQAVSSCRPRVGSRAGCPMLKWAPGKPVAKAAVSTGPVAKAVSSTVQVTGASLNTLTF